MANEYTHSETSRPSTDPFGPQPQGQSYDAAAQRQREANDYGDQQQQRGADEYAPGARRDDEPVETDPSVRIADRSDQPVEASQRLRAFEDERFGSDEFRLNGEIQKGHGSKWRTLTNEQRAYHASLERLVAAERHFSVAQGAAEKAKLELDAANERVKVSEEAAKQSEAKAKADADLVAAEDNVRSAVGNDERAKAKTELEATKARVKTENEAFEKRKAEKSKAEADARAKAAQEAHATA